MEDLQTTNDKPKEEKKDNLIVQTDNRKKETKEPAEVIPEWAKKLISTNKKLQEEVDMFKELAGANKIASYEDSKKKYNLKKAYLKVYKGFDSKKENKIEEIVVGWESLDYSEFNANAMKSEDENIKQTLILKNKEKVVVNYMSFTKTRNRIWVDLISNNGEISKVRFENGEKMNIPTKFLNA